MHLIPQFRSFDPYSSIAESKSVGGISSFSSWRES